MSIRTDYPDGTWEPSPGAAPAVRRITTQARFDLLSTLRNGEQLLLTLVIPLVLLVALTLFDFGGGDAASIDVVTPSIIALAVMSTAFASLAISTGFDRRSGALRLLGTTPLTRGDLILARTISVLAIEALQIVLICAVALLLGWQAKGPTWAALVLVLLGTAAFAAAGVALAGVLRAEATLAVANGIYLLLMLGGGVVVPLSSLPGAWATIAAMLPSGALAEGLRTILLDGALPPWWCVVVLLAWAVGAGAMAARTFRWD